MFLESYQAAFDTPLDELELFMRIRNALAEQRSDNQNDELARQKK